MYSKLPQRHSNNPKTVWWLHYLRTMLLSKALFRRGVARRHEGFLDEARTDLLRVCQLDKTNADARRELKIVNDKLAEARAKDRKVSLAYLNCSACV